MCYSAWSWAPDEAQPINCLFKLFNCQNKFLPICLSTLPGHNALTWIQGYYRRHCSSLIQKPSHLLTIRLNGSHLSPLILNPQRVSCGFKSPLNKTAPIDNDSCGTGCGPPGSIPQALPQDQGGNHLGC